MSRLITDKDNGTVMIFEKTTADTGGAYLEIETSLPPHAKGPPPHVHYRQDEEVVVVSGALGVNIGGEIATLRAGERATLPRGVWHTFWNASGEELRLKGTVRPAGSFEPYIRAMYAATHVHPSGRRSLFDVAYLFHRYADEFAPAGMPRSVQRLLFPGIVRLGRWLGKYDAARLQRLEPPFPADPGDRSGSTRPAEEDA